MFALGPATSLSRWTWWTSQWPQWVNVSYVATCVRTAVPSMPCCAPHVWQSPDSAWFAARPPGPPAPHWQTHTSPVWGTVAGRVSLEAGARVVVAAVAVVGAGGGVAGAGAPFIGPPGRGRSP